MQPEAGWVDTLGLLNEDREPREHPVLPATLDAEPEALLLRREGPRRHEAQVLRLWHAPVRMRDGTPLWIGSSQTLRYTQPFGLFGLWQPGPGGSAALAAVRGDVQGLRVREEAHAPLGGRVLLVDTRASAAKPIEGARIE